MLVEYKMQAQGDTESGLGTQCSGIYTLLTSDPANCGNCGDGCPSNQTCLSGACGPPGGCGSGQTLCSGQCVSLQNNLNNCGACGNVCQQVPNSSPACTSGVCSLVCQAGFGNCDGIYSNGCETNLQTDPNNCGGCGLACQSGQSCVSGVCQMSCGPDRPFAPATTAPISKLIPITTVRAALTVHSDLKASPIASPAFAGSRATPGTETAITTPITVVKPTL